MDHAVVEAAVVAVAGVAWPQKNCHTDDVLPILMAFEAKKHHKYRHFLRLGSPKPRYLRGCLPLGSKNVFFFNSVFWPGPSKNTGHRKFESLTSVL